MQFPYYGHSVFYFWFNIFLAVFGLLWAWILVFRLKRSQSGSGNTLNWILLFWFIFWLPHSSYYSLELVKHLVMKVGVLEPIVLSWNFVGGVFTYLAISIIGAISCVVQISWVINSWKKYNGGRAILVFFLVLFGASLGTIIGLCNINFFHNPIVILGIIWQIIILRAPFDCFNLGQYWPIIIGGSLFFVWMISFMMFGEYICSSEKNKSD